MINEIQKMKENTIPGNRLDCSMRVWYKVQEYHFVRWKATIEGQGVPKTSYGRKLYDHGARFLGILHFNSQASLLPVPSSFREKVLIQYRAPLRRQFIDASSAVCMLHLTASSPFFFFSIEG